MRRIYASDMGAGNTNMYWIAPIDRINPTGTKPASLINENGEPSGYVVWEKGLKVGIGIDGLYGLEYSELDLIAEFHLNWKEVPSEESRDRLTKYFRAWNDKLRSERAQDFEGVDEEIWFVGCPTGGKWKRASVRRLYKEILEDAGFKNVTVIPESNGALAYYHNQRQILNNLQSTTKVILFDLGAYSIDATHFNDDKITSYGQYLGASLIEKMIVRAVLYGINGNVLKNRGHALNDPESVEKAREEYEHPTRGKIFHDFLQLKAREIKETFFSRQSYGNEPKFGVISQGVYSYDFGEGVELYLDLLFSENLRKNLMEDFPIRELLGDEFYQEPAEVRKYIGNATWMETLEKFLNETAEKFSLGDGSDVRIMLTGGGSLMKCVQEKIRDRFPNATVYDDKNSIIATGYGLATWGPDKVRAEDFKKKYREFLDRTEIDADGDRILVLHKKLFHAFIECVQEMLGDISQKEVEVLRSCISDWKNYKYTSYRIPDKFGEKFGEWCQNTGAPRFNRNFAAKIEALKVILNKDFETLVVNPLNLATKLGNLSTLLPAGGNAFVAITEALAKIGFRIVTEIITDHYKNGELPEEILSNFNNDDKSAWYNIFRPSDPRGDFHDANKETLDKWSEAETKATGRLCFQTFCGYELPLNNDFKPTMMQFFIAEARKYLEDQMESRVKAILGKLVLEEILPEEEEEILSEED